MITSYQLKKLDGGEVGLFLYVSEEFEFSLDFLSKIRKFNLEEFFRAKGIDFSGVKVFLVVGGVVLALAHFPVVKKEEIKDFPDFVTRDAMFVEKVDSDSGDGKYSEAISYLNHFLESSTTAKFYNENYGVDVDSESDTLKDVEILDDNKDLVGTGVNKDSSNSNSGVDVQNNNVSNSISASVNSKNQVEVEEVIQSETLKEELKQDEIKHEESKNFGVMVQVHRSDGTILSLEMDEYLVGVVASEMPASFNIEALKVQSILARTYAMKRIESGGILTDTVATQRYMDESEMRKMWGSGFDKYYQKVKSAVDATKGQVVLYRGVLIDAVYHSTSNGKTEDAAFVWGNAFPYLVSVDSSWDKNVGSFSGTVSFDVEKLCSIFEVSSEELSFQILSRNESGRVEMVQVGDKTYSGIEVRTLLGLRSSDFDISYDGEKFVFETRGYGHGVGLSQYGANEMARLGYSYSDIIKHYYTGVTIGSISN